MKIKFKSIEIKHKTAVRRCVSDGHHGHYGSTYCSECLADAEDHYKKCPKCGAIFTKTEYS